MCQSIATLICKVLATVFDLKYTRKLFNNLLSALQKSRDIKIEHFCFETLPNISYQHTCLIFFAE